MDDKVARLGRLDACAVSDALDKLQLTGGSATSVTHAFTNASDGTVAIDGKLITYTGLEPIIDNLTATNRIFTFGAAADNITLSDGPTPGDG